MPAPSTRSKSKLSTKKSAEHVYVYVYAAVEGTPAALPGPGMPGGGPPRAIPIAEHTSLIVSSVPSDTYNALSIEARLSDLDWVASAGAAHHAVVDALVSHTAVVLPFRLLTIFSTEEKAVTTAREKLPAIRRAFARVRGSEEWVLHIGRPDPSRLPPADAAPRARSGTDFLATKALKRREDLSRAERIKSDAVASYEALQRVAEAAKTKPVDPSGTLLLDAAFLVRPSQLESLKHALTKAAERLLRDGCRVSLTGPWPPYSFASVDVESEADA